MSKIVTCKTPEQPWPDFPVPSDWIKEGSPLGHGMVMIESTDKKTALGCWQCSPGKFEWEYENDEMLFVLEGEGTVTEEDGTTHNVGAGDAVYLPKGLKTTWDVKKTVRKVFVVINTPQAGETAV